MEPIVIPAVVEFESPDIHQKHVRTFVFKADRPAVPLLFSVEARADGIPEWDGPA
jgi:hypothetical protein